MSEEQREALAKEADVLHVERDRKARAEELLNHDLLQEAFRTIAEEIDTAWRDSPAGDADGREKLWMMQRLLKRVEDHIRNVVISGKMAEKRIEQLERDPLYKRLFGLRAA